MRRDDNKPGCKKSRIDTMEPKCAKLFSNMDELSVTRSGRDAMGPRRVMLKTEIRKPKQAKL